MMDASRLTKEQKAGKISQEEFFIRLNKLRLANNAKACVASLEVHPPTSEVRIRETEAPCLHQENEDRVPDLGVTISVISDGNSDGNNVDPEDPARDLRQGGERCPSMNTRVTELGEYRQQDDSASQPLAGHSNPPTPPRMIREGSSKHRAPVLGNAPEYGASSERIELPNPGSTHERATPPRVAADCSVSTTRGLPPTGGVRCLQNPDGSTNSEECTLLPVRSRGGESTLPAPRREPCSYWHHGEMNISVEEYNRVAWVGLSPRGSRTSYLSARHFLHPSTDIHARITSDQSLRQLGPRSGTRLCIHSCPNNGCPKKRTPPCGNVISHEDHSIPHQGERERSLLNKHLQEFEGEAPVSSERPRTLDFASSSAVSGLGDRSSDASTNRRERRKRCGDSCGNTGIPLSPPPYPRSQQGYAEQYALGADDSPPSVTEQASSGSARCRPPSPPRPSMHDRQRRGRSDGDHGAEVANREDKSGETSVPSPSGTRKFDEPQPKGPPGSCELHAVAGRAGRKRAPGSLYERTTEWRARVCEAR